MGEERESTAKVVLGYAVVVALNLYYAYRQMPDWERAALRQRMTARYRAGMARLRARAQNLHRVVATTIDFDAARAQVVAEAEATIAQTP